MPFQPNVGDALNIDGVAYRIAERPAARGMPYGQEGRQGIVFQLAAPSDSRHQWAGNPQYRGLKVFKPRYRVAGLVSLSDQLATFANLPGLAVCRRAVLTAQRHGALLQQHPDLVYSVLMPWIDGPTWMEVMLAQRELTPELSLTLARSLVDVLAALEQRNMAHCDLSGPNVLLPGLVNGTAPSSARSAVALVDVEQLYAPGLDRPELLPGGALGYAQHRGGSEGLWESRADRFAGAVLIAEMLGWSDERIRQAGWGENYFDPAEMQQDSEHYRLLATVLEDRWGPGVRGLFERAWRSETLSDCATFGEWLVVLPETAPTLGARATLTQPPRPAPDATPTLDAAPERSSASTVHLAPSAPDSPVRALIDAAHQLEQQGNRGGALGIYRQVQALAPAGSGLSRELELIVQQLEALLATQAAGIPGSAPTAVAAPGTTAPTLPPAAPPRKWILVALLALIPVALVVLVLSTAEPSRLFGFLQPPAPTAAPQPSPAAVAALPPTTVPASPPPTTPPTPAPIATLTVDQAWKAALDALEDPWGRDWPRAIAMIDDFRGKNTGYRPADEKLYAALLFYADQLFYAGAPEQAIQQLVRAQSDFPNRPEARATLIALTPTATPEPTTEPAPVPVQRAPAPAPAPAPRAPAPAPAPGPAPGSAPPPRPLTP